MAVCMLVMRAPTIPFHTTPVARTPEVRSVCLMVLFGPQSPPVSSFTNLFSFTYPPPQPPCLPHSVPRSHGISPHSLPTDCRFPSVFSDTLTTFTGASGDILLCAVPSSRAGEGLTIEPIWPPLSSRPCPRTRLLLCSLLAVRVTSDYPCEDPLCARELLDGVFFLQAPDHRIPCTQVETPERSWHL